MRLYRRLTAVSGLAVVVLALSACGDDGSAGNSGASDDAGASEVSEERNAADVEFAQMMIVHHRGAIEMAELAADRADSAEVVELAERISAAQGPEIETMSSWLEAWGEEVPEDSSMGGMEGMDHGSMGEESMPGMMSEEQMAELEAASGAEFDRLFLEMMTEHHAGAIEMARTEQFEGANPQAIELADTIEADQEAEIAEMQQLLQQL